MSVRMMIITNDDSDNHNDGQTNHINDKNSDDKEIYIR